MIFQCMLSKIGKISTEVQSVTGNVGNSSVTAQWRTSCDVCMQAKYHSGDSSVVRALDS